MGRFWITGRAPDGTMHGTIAGTIACIRHTIRNCATGESMAATGQAKPAGGSFHTLTQRQIIGTMTGVMLTLLLAALDQTIVGTAMPRIIAQLNGFERYAWVTTVYLLTSTAAVPIFGKLSDIYGRKWFYLGGAVLFVVASALCGAAGSIPGVPGDGMTQLILFRGLQGVGGGIIMAITFTIIGDIFPPAVRGKYQGLLSAVWGMSSVFGPTLGGWITDSFSWRWIFYINLPVGILAITALMIAFPYFKPEGVKRVIDFAGVATLLAALVPLLLALTWVTNYGWAAPRVVGLLVLAAVMIAAFILAESRAVEPLLPLSLFRDRVISLSTVSVFLTGMAMFGSILFIPLFMQTVIGVSATQSGSLLTPMMVIWSVGSISAGQLVARMGRYKMIVLVGMALMTVGLFLLARMTAATTRPTVVVFMLLIGMGMGLTMPIFTLIVQNAAPQRQIGAATATVQFFRQIGSTVGAAVFGSIMLTRYQSHFSGTVPVGTPASALAAFKDPLQLAQVLPQLKDQFAALPNGPQLLQTLLANTKDALVYAITGVFLISAILTVIAFATDFWLKEVPLRKSFAPPVMPEAEGVIVSSETPLGAPALSGQGDD
jgi:EmrB/QacA subfamily drug resistance transporter